MLDWRGLGSLSHLPRKKHVCRKMWKNRVPVHSRATGRISPSVEDLCSESPSVPSVTAFRLWNVLDSACTCCLSSVMWPSF